MFIAMYLVPCQSQLKWDLYYNVRTIKTGVTYKYGLVQYLMDHQSRQSLSAQKVNDLLIIMMMLTMVMMVIIMMMMMMMNIPIALYYDVSSQKYT